MLSTVMNCSWVTDDDRKTNMQGIMCELSVNLLCSIVEQKLTPLGVNFLNRSTRNFRLSIPTPTGQVVMSVTCSVAIEPYMIVGSTSVDAPKYCIDTVIIESGEYVNERRFYSSDEFIEEILRISNNSIG